MTSMAAIAMDEATRKEVLAALSAYLPAQRWFGAKARKITAVHETVFLDVPGTSGKLALLDVEFADGPREMYQLPLALGAADEAANIRGRHPNAVITELADGSLVYDASVSAEFRASLLTLIAQGKAVGNLQAHHSLALQPASLPPESRLSRAEQSNTSIFFGDQFVLKLYRRVQPGENPDVEVPRFLAEETSFRNTPEYLGELEEGGHQRTLAFLQRFAANDGDAWAWFANQLDEFTATVASHITPPTSDALALATSTARVAVEAAALIGQRTAELHQALACPTSNAAIASETYTVTTLAADAGRIHAQIAATLDVLKQWIVTLDGPLQAQASQLLARKQDLMDCAHTIATGSPLRFGRRIRIHGDYHLGQLLRANGDFLIVDFEGEPARSIEARRRKDSPLRDVAGMMRSFSYAAAACRMKREPAVSPKASAWMQWWEDTCSRTFLEAYEAAFKNSDNLLPQPAQAAILLRACLLEKSLYELMYELNNRPAWVGIPLQGVLSILDTQGNKRDVNDGRT